MAKFIRLKAVRANNTIVDVRVNVEAIQYWVPHSEFPNTQTRMSFEGTRALTLPYKFEDVDRLITSTKAEMEVAVQPLKKREEFAVTA